MQHTWRITYLSYGFPRSTMVQGSNVHEALDVFTLANGIPMILSVEFVVPHAG